MIVCRRRHDYRRGFKLSAAFNVSQHDPEPLRLFMQTLGCGHMRKGGSSGWYREVNRLLDLRSQLVPFFERFPLVGQKANDFRLWRSAIAQLSNEKLSDQDYRAVLALRERMNRDGKRRHQMNGILRDYTPSPSA